LILVVRIDLRSIKYFIMRVSRRLITEQNKDSLV